MTSCATPGTKISGFANLGVVDIQKSDQNVPDVSPDEPLAAETAEGQLAAVSAERDQLAAEKADLQDRLLRARAEFENFRRRAERERSEYLQFAAGDFVLQILPVLDDFERALKTEVILWSER